MESNPPGWILLVPVGILLLGFLFVVLEVFVPSGGVLGLGAAILITTAVVLGFLWGGERTGVIILLVAAVVTPVLVVWAFRVWPETALGQEMVLFPPNDDRAGQKDQEASPSPDLEGKTGRAVTDLLPGGVVEVGGGELSAVATLAPVPKGTVVRVKEVRVSYVVVEPCLEDSPRENSASSS